jgi:hypothetical protein
VGSPLGPARRGASAPARQTRARDGRSPGVWVSARLGVCGSVPLRGRARPRVSGARWVVQVQGRKGVGRCVPAVREATGRACTRGEGRACERRATSRAGGVDVLCERATGHRSKTVGCTAGARPFFCTRKRAGRQSVGMSERSAGVGPPGGKGGRSWQVLKRGRQY